MAPFKFQNLDHVVIRVRDKNLMMNVFCEVLGCSIERSIEDASINQLRVGAEFDLFSQYWEFDSTKTSRVFEL